MERGLELEDHLDKAALERFGRISICFMHRNRRDAHTGEYHESLQDAYLELSQAGRPGLSTRVGTVIESLFVEGASQ